jgi:hypothetical protein
MRSIAMSTTAAGRQHMCRVGLLCWLSGTSVPKKDSFALAFFIFLAAPASSGGMLNCSSGDYFLNGCFK